MSPDLFAVKLFSNVNETPQNSTRTSPSLPAVTCRHATCLSVKRKGLTAQLISGCSYVEMTCASWDRGDEQRENVIKQPWGSLPVSLRGPAVLLLESSLATED